MSDKKALEQEIATLQKTKTDLMKELGIANNAKQLNEYRKRLSNEIDSSNKQVLSLGNKVNALNDERESINKDIKVAEATLQRILKDTNGERASLETIAKNLNERETKISDDEKDIKSKYSDIDVEWEQIEDNEKLIAKHNIELVETRKKLETKERNIDFSNSNWSKSLGERENTVERLEESADDRYAELKKEKEKIDKDRAEVDSLIAKNQALLDEAKSQKINTHNEHKAILVKLQEIKKRKDHLDKYEKDLKLKNEILTTNDLEQRALSKRVSVLINKYKLEKILDIK